MNPSYSRITGCTESDVLDRTFDEDTGQHSRFGYVRQAWSIDQRVGHWRGELINVRKDGENLASSGQKRVTYPGAVL